MKCTFWDLKNREITAKGRAQRLYKIIKVGQKQCLIQRLDTKKVLPVDTVFLLNTLNN